MEISVAFLLIRSHDSQSQNIVIRFAILLILLRTTRAAPDAMLRTFRRNRTFNNAPIKVHSSNRRLTSSRTNNLDRLQINASADRMEDHSLDSLDRPQATFSIIQEDHMDHLHLDGILPLHTKDSIHLQVLSLHRTTTRYRRVAQGKTCRCLRSPINPRRRMGLQHLRIRSQRLRKALRRQTARRPLRASQTRLSRVQQGRQMRLWLRLRVLRLQLQSLHREGPQAKLPFPWLMSRLKMWQKPRKEILRPPLLDQRQPRKQLLALLNNIKTPHELPLLLSQPPWQNSHRLQEELLKLNKATAAAVSTI